MPHSHNHFTYAPEIINIAVIIVSTSRYNEKSKDLPSSDRSLPIFREKLTSYVHKKSNSRYKIQREIIIPDDNEHIQNILAELTSSNQPTLHVIIFSGGTGITDKDITIENIDPYIDKELPGFGELFRVLSYEEIGSAAILSRAKAALIKDKIVFCLPGSPKAVSLALDKLILPELPHIISEIHREKS